MEDRYTTKAFGLGLSVMVTIMLVLNALSFGPLH